MPRPCSFRPIPAHLPTRETGAVRHSHEPHKFIADARRRRPNVSAQPRCARKRVHVTSSLAPYLLGRGQTPLRVMCDGGAGMAEEPSKADTAMHAVEAEIRRLHDVAAVRVVTVNLRRPIEVDVLATRGHTPSTWCATCNQSRSPPSTSRCSMRRIVVCRSHPATRTTTERARSS
jgi:hypothetical protein